MIDESVQYLDISIFKKIAMLDGGFIALVDPLGDDWSTLYMGNHNIFRFDSKFRAIWQVSRVEDGYDNWESRHRHARERDPTCEGYLDRFMDIGNQFFEQRRLPYRGPFHPTFEIIPFDEYLPGRLLGARTNRWGYDIDPETGVATCTGEQQK